MTVVAVIPCRWCFYCKRDLESMCADSRIGMDTVIICIRILQPTNRTPTLVW